MLNVLFEKIHHDRLPEIRRGKLASRNVCHRGMPGARALARALTRFVTRVLCRDVRPIVAIHVAIMGLALSSGGIAAAGERVALVVGNNSYNKAPLINPINDATAIGAALNKMGYRTTVINNADRSSMENALDEFSLKAEKADYALFFYAGHAIQVDGKNYLIPVGSRLKNRRDIKRLIELDDVTEELGRSSRLGVAIIDACRNNPFAHELNGSIGRSVVSRGLARARLRSGNVLVAYATEEDAIADDGLGQHSPYTSALLQHIDNPETDVRLMFGQVRDTVIANTNGSQRPYVYGSIGGSQYFLNAIKVITDADIKSATTRFQALASAIQKKDRKLIKKLASPAQAWSRYLDYMLDNFDSIELSLSPPVAQTQGSDSVISASLKVEQLVSANGDIGMPSEQLRSVVLTSKRSGDDWSAISW